MDISILIVDDEEDMLQVLKARFSAEGYMVTTATSGIDALHKAKLLIPDVIILDVMMPDMNGMDVKMHLNQDEKTADIPVIFLTANTLIENKVKGFELQASDYITKPFEFADLLARVSSLTNRQKHYEKKFMTDAITGLNNVHVFKKNLKWLFDIAKRYKRPFSIIMIDLNEFKHINDTYGHNTGDLVLKRTADVMRKTFRKQDVLIRYGGDEFVVLLPETDHSAAQKAAVHFKTEISRLVITQSSGDNQQPFQFSVSVGLASYASTMKNETELFEMADRNMYADKQSTKDKKKGKNP